MSWMEWLEIIGPCFLGICVVIMAVRGPRKTIYRNGDKGPWD